MRDFAMVGDVDPQLSFVESLSLFAFGLLLDDLFLFGLLSTSIKI